MPMVSLSICLRVILKCPVITFQHVLKVHMRIVTSLSFRSSVDTLRTILAAHTIRILKLFVMFVGQLLFES